MNRWESWHGERDVYYVIGYRLGNCQRVILHGDTLARVIVCETSSWPFTVLARIVEPSRLSRFHHRHVYTLAHSFAIEVLQSHDLGGLRYWLLSGRGEAIDVLFCDMVMCHLWRSLPWQLRESRWRKWRKSWKSSWHQGNGCLSYVFEMSTCTWYQPIQCGHA